MSAVAVMAPDRDARIARALGTVLADADLLTSIMETVRLPLRLDDADGFLQAWAPPLRQDVASAYLAYWRGDVVLLELYRHFFPHDFAASTADYQRPNPETPSAMELEFFCLVDERLFPCWPELVHAPPPHDPGKWAVPITGECFDEYEPMSLRSEGWQALLLLIGFKDTLYGSSLGNRPLGAVLAGALPMRDENHVFDFIDDLENGLADRHSGVALMARMAHHMTDNRWLDASSWDADYVRFTVEELEEASTEYAESERLRESIESAALWLEQPANFAEVVEIWNRQVN